MSKLVSIEFQGVEIGDFKLDNSEITVPEELKDSVKGLIQHIYDAVQEIETLHAKMDKMEGEVAGWKAKAADPGKLDEAVKAREEILDVACSYMDLKKDDLRPLTNDQIKRKIAEKRLGKLDENASEGFVEGVFEAVKSDADREDAAKRNTAELGRNTGDSRAREESPRHYKQQGGGQRRKTIRDAGLENLHNMQNKTDHQMAAEAAKTALN